MKKPVQKEFENFTIQINHSEEAIEKKMMKFITPSGDSFEISADEMATILMTQVNSELIEATFVESEKVNVVEVMRQIRVIADRDIKEGEEIRLDYTHPYPIEFAIIEQAMNIAKIKMDVPVFTLTKEYIDEVALKVTPEQKKFVDKFYAFFKNLFNNKKKN